MSGIDYESNTASPAPPKRLTLWPTFVAWLVIAASAGLIIVAGLRPRGAPPANLDPALVPSTEVLMQSRIAIGMHRLLGGGGATHADAAPTPVAGLAGALDQTAKTPLARLRAIPAVAEMGGALDAGEEVRKRLDALSGEPGFPTSLRGDLDALKTVYTDGPAALAPADRESLVARHGWFGELALAYGLPDTEPERRAALAPATRAAWTMIVMLSGAGLGCVVGLGLLVWAIVAYGDGSLRFAYVPPPPGRSGPFVEAFAVYLLGMVLLGIAVPRFLPNAGFAANWLLALAVPPAVLWPRLRGLSWAEIRAGLGWHRGRGLWREASLGIVGYVAGLPLLALAVVVTSFLARLSNANPSHPVMHEAGAGGLVHVLQLFALVAVYAPLVEETFFRGALYHHVRRRLPWWLAALAVGLLFAAIHPQGWVGIPMLTTVALVMAVLREWRGSIVAPVVTHACVNLVTTTMLVLMTT